MNKLLFITIALFSTSTFAEPVFKCKAPSGKVTYQNEKCSENGQVKEVEIIPGDPAAIEIAREKLHKSLEEQTKLDAERAALDYEQQSLEDADATVEQNNTTSEEQPEKKSFYLNVDPDN